MPQEHAGWFKHFETLHDHPKTLKLADLLNKPPYAAVGICSMIWEWAVSHSDDGLMENSTRTLGRIVGYEGKHEDVYDALLKSGFLAFVPNKENPENPKHLIIHNWTEYQSGLIEARAKNAAKMRDYRAKIKAEKDAKLPPA